MKCFLHALNTKRANYCMIRSCFITLIKPWFKLYSVWKCQGYENVVFISHYIISTLYLIVFWYKMLQSFYKIPPVLSDFLLQCIYVTVNVFATTCRVIQLILSCMYTFRSHVDHVKWLRRSIMKEVTPAPMKFSTWFHCHIRYVQTCTYNDFDV